MACLTVLDRTGDTKLIYDPNIPVEVENAREMFANLKKKGYIAYTVDAGGEKGEIIREFDPKAGKIIMAPKMVGG